MCAPLCISARDMCTSEGHAFYSAGAHAGVLPSHPIATLPPTDISAVASHLLGPSAIHYGVERQQKLFEYSSAKLDSLGLTSIQLVCANCFSIDPALSMRFDRIYVGAGASEDASFLMSMLEVCPLPSRSILWRSSLSRSSLSRSSRCATQPCCYCFTQPQELACPSPPPHSLTQAILCQFTLCTRSPMVQVGGTLVGPFQDLSSSSQSLIKCRRTSETEFVISELLSVHFTPLISPKSGADAKPITICAPRWSPDQFARFPPTHRAVIRTLLALHAQQACLLSVLPKEVIVECIFPHIAYSWFSGAPPSPTPSPAPPDVMLQDRKRAFSRALRAAARALFGGAE